MLKAIISCLFFVLFLSQKGQAQTEFMPIGAKVYGTSGALGFWGTFTLTSEKDTLCGGVPCRKLVHIDKSSSTPEIRRYVYFTKQVKSSIFLWDERLQQFDFMYKTNMVKGDSIPYTYRRSAYGDTLSVTLFVDSVKVINSMQIASCRMYCPPFTPVAPSNQAYFPIYDRFGTLYNFSPIWFCEFGFFAGFYDGFRYTPTCYMDNEISVTIPNRNGFTCASRTPINELTDINLTVSPNPIQNYLDISCNENTLIRKCTLFDALGHTLQEKEFDDAKTAHWTLNNHTNGVYLLKIQTSLGYSIVKKIIVSQ